MNLFFFTSPMPSYKFNELGWVDGVGPTAYAVTGPFTVQPRKAAPFQSPLAGATTSISVSPPMGTSRCRPGWWVSACRPPSPTSKIICYPRAIGPNSLLPRTAQPTKATAIKPKILTSAHSILFEVKKLYLINQVF